MRKNSYLRRQRCYELSETLDRAIVLAGDASDRELLLEENIEDTDVFCAVTNDDEANIMSSMLAKSLGAKKVITLINNPAYVDLIEGSDIDITISPQQATLGSILTHIRRGDVVRVHSLRRGAAEATTQASLQYRCDYMSTMWWNHAYHYRHHRPRHNPENPRSH